MLLRNCLSTAAGKLKKLVGPCLWKQIVRTVGGEIVYIPVDHSYYEKRNKAISQFAQHHTVNETARHFFLSPRQVKKILSTVR